VVLVPSEAHVLELSVDYVVGAFGSCARRHHRSSIDPYSRSSSHSNLIESSRLKRANFFYGRIFSKSRTARISEAELISETITAKWSDHHKRKEAVGVHHNFYILVPLSLTFSSDPRTLYFNSRVVVEDGWFFELLDADNVSSILFFQ
jgi:hypothetical protein